MRSATLFTAGILVAATAAFTFQNPAAPPAQPAAAAPLAVAAPTAVAEDANSFLWERPAGPLKVALQAGHWKAAEAPDEQRGLRTNGTYGGGKAEWEVNLEIARRTAQILTDAGYEVDVLPTTIPPGYFADLFLSIHADGNPSTSISGYRASHPRRDVTGRAEAFSDLLEESYGAATGLRHYPTVTRRMQNYYAFNYRRYEHALHPMTVAAILETGFLTNAGDRRVIVSDPDRAARGIASAVTLFLKTLPLEPKLVTIGRDIRPRGLDRPAVSPRIPDVTPNPASVTPANAGAQ